MRFFLLFGLLWAAPAGAASFDVAVLLGDAINLDTPLTLSQSDLPDLELTAHYSTRGLELPVHYTIRVARGDSAGAWELGFVHHKIYLEDAPPEIDRFEISHGFNMLTVNRVWKWRPLPLRVGAGIVIANSESIVRGYTHLLNDAGWGEGYRLTGPVVLLGTERAMALSTRLDLVVDGTVSYGRARVPIGKGHAVATNAAGHLSAGFRYRP